MSASLVSEPTLPPVLLLPVSYRDRRYGENVFIHVGLNFGDQTEMDQVLAAFREGR
jgi:hypothetical protein